MSVKVGSLAVEELVKISNEVLDDFGMEATPFMIDWYNDFRIEVSPDMPQKIEVPGKNRLGLICISNRYFFKKAVLETYREKLVSRGEPSRSYDFVAEGTDEVGKRLHRCLIEGLGCDEAAIMMFNVDKPPFFNVGLLVYVIWTSVSEQYIYFHLGVGIVAGATMIATLTIPWLFNNWQMIYPPIIGGYLVASAVGYQWWVWVVSTGGSLVLHLRKKWLLRIEEEEWARDVEANERYWARATAETAAMHSRVNIEQRPTLEGTGKQATTFSSSPVVVVTGANKGIGYEISKKLIADGAKVIMTARDQARLDKAAGELHPFGAVLLDVTREASVTEARDKIMRLSPSVDVVINNAGYSYKGEKAGYDEARKTMEVNYFGAQRVTEALMPLLTVNGRIVSPSIQKKLADPSVTVATLNNLAEDFLQAVRDDRVVDAGFINPDLGAEGIECMTKYYTYGVSKLFLTAWTKALAREAMADPRSIVVTGCCPGFCQTDITGRRGPRSAQVGALVASWLAAQVEYDPSMSGKLYRDWREYRWEDGMLVSTGTMYAS
ncbi:hypothetical protein FOL47_007894 [Perkinsus chesapeaki]|uniref:Uncharacterized protein n=1 Tax=Perkinsus chesapeaki TaxID=330153 RepID=A0A7J6LHJ5_PERCH|nr:hypothetical protein FOL47_007894 [Perkinsus chesapeaki]